MNDGCEWCPDADRPAWKGDLHGKATPAVVLVGSNGTWRLCASCADLPRFKRFKARRPIR